METAVRKGSAVQTVGAIPLALVTWLIASTLASAIWYLINAFTTVIRPEIIGFISNIIGGILGVVAAKAATDKWLPRSSAKSVAVAFFGFFGLLLFMEWGFIPNPAHPIVVSAGILAGTWAAYYSYWLGLEIS